MPSIESIIAANAIKLATFCHISSRIGSITKSLYEILVDGSEAISV